MKTFSLKALLLTLSINGVVLILNFYLPNIERDFVSQNERETTSKHILLGNSLVQTGRHSQKLESPELHVSGSSPVTGYFQLQRILQHNPFVKNTPIETVFLGYGALHTNGVIYSPVAKYMPYEEYKELFLLRDRLNDQNFIFTLHKNRFVTPVWVHFGAEYLNLSWLRIYSNVLALFQPTQPPTNNYFNRVNQQKPALWDSRYSYTWSPVLQHYLSKIKELCEQNDIRCIWLHMPMNQNARFPEKRFFDRYYNILDSIGFEQVPKKIIFMDNENFTDNFGHLNENGATRFDKKYLRPQLKKIGIEMNTSGELINPKK